MILDKYRNLEVEISHRISKGLLDDSNVIRDPKEIFPEYDLSCTYGIHRPGVNIGTILFFYEKVIAFVPPMKKSDFPSRFGVTFEVFMDLAYPNDNSEAVILPMLNHPRMYKNKRILNELMPLIEQFPPTWERWHQILKVSTDHYWFKRSDETFHYQKMVQNPEIRKYYAKKLGSGSNHLISRDIKQQVKNNYTNLCLAGLEDYANNIARNSFRNPIISYNELLYWSDVIAYPKVMGGGVANIRVNRIQNIESKSILKERKVGFESLKHYDSDIVEVLLNGFKFNSIPKVIRLDFLREWHRSSNAQRAREVYKEILKIARNRNISEENVFNNMRIIINELNDFSKNVIPHEDSISRELCKKNNIVSKVTSIGGILSTLIGLFTLETEMAFTGIVLTGIGMKKFYSESRYVERKLKELRFDVGIDLYKEYRELKIFLDRFSTKNIIPVKGINLTNDIIIPPRTLWWSE